MPSNFRYAVFAAVSTDEQAIDHVSLENQVRDAREFAARFGGVETCGPFIADGYSRSFYEGLSEAMAEIPPLKEAILAAERNQYDVLIVRYFERLGVVAYPVFIRLGKHKKQLRSVQEPTPIAPPEIYDPTKDEATSTMIHLAGLKQDYRINRIINNLRDAMPKRIKSGLTPSRISYGYKYVNNKTAPVLDARKSSKLIHARDMLMAGESYVKIGKYLGVHRSRVPTVLSNPYYTGQVSYNKTYIQRIGMKRRQIDQPKSKWTIAQGKHKPIFTQSEHDEIVAEIERRSELERHHDIGFVFSGLLRCAVCGERVRWHKHGSKDKYKKVIVCRSAGARHVRYLYDDFIDRVVHEIQREMEKERSGHGPQREDKSEIIRHGIEENKKRRARVHEGYESGIYDAAEASAKLRDLEKEAETLYKKLERTAASAASRKDASELMSQIDIKRLPQYLRTRDPKQLNRLLASWIEEIQVGEKIKIIRRP